MEKLARPSLDKLPDNFIARIPQLGAIKVLGADTDKYLQGQLTCDVNALTDTDVLIGGHCDAKGKLFSIFRLIQRDNSKLLIQPTSCLGSSLAELKKFGVFSQVDINEDNELCFSLLVGDQAKSLIQETFDNIPDTLTPVINHNGFTAIYLPGNIERYLLISSQAQQNTLVKQSALTELNSEVWNLLEITEGIAVINEAAVAEYVPQMLNLQAINGISFTKGCYLGQETVARMQYLGKNKRALFSLSGKSTALSASITNIEMQLSDNWRRAGTILTSYQSDDQLVYVQAVLASDTNEQTKLRIKEQADINLSISALPYNLNR